MQCGLGGTYSEEIKTVDSFFLFGPDTVDSWFFLLLFSGQYCCVFFFFGLILFQDYGSVHFQTWVRVRVRVRPNIRAMVWMSGQNCWFDPDQKKIVSLTNKMFGGAVFIFYFKFFFMFWFSHTSVQIFRSTDEWYQHDGLIMRAK